MSEAWLHVRSSIATGICNLDSERNRNSALDKRQEGWTEVWGDDADDAKTEAWLHEQEVISRYVSLQFKFISFL